jgi:hypothetical protein
MIRIVYPGFEFGSRGQKGTGSWIRSATQMLTVLWIGILMDPHHLRKSRFHVEVRSRSRHQSLNSGAVETCNRAMENTLEPWRLTVESCRVCRPVCCRFASLMTIRVRIKVRSRIRNRIKVKSWTRIRK